MRIIINVFMPMFLGGIIYIIYRAKSLLMFNWIERIGFEKYVIILRERYSDLVILPYWVKYSLPDGIWIYSLTSIMIIIWANKNNKTKYLWILIGPFMGIFGELGQLLHIISGTFDIIDLSISILAGVLPIIIFNEFGEMKNAFKD